MRGKKAKAIRKYCMDPVEGADPTEKRRYYQRVKTLYRKLNRIKKRGLFKA